MRTEGYLRHESLARVARGARDLFSLLQSTRTGLKVIPVTASPAVRFQPSVTRVSALASCSRWSKLVIALIAAGGSATATQLQIEKHPDKLTLAWSTNVERHISVESTSLLPGTWTPRMESVSESGELRRMDVAPADSVKFFRLYDPLFAADAARGGALYDSYWPVTGATVPTGNHPLWASRPDLITNPRTGPDTFRCKECHGWDYQGVNGAYGGGSHRTGIGGIFGTTKTAPQLLDLLKNHHGYGDLGLSDAEIEHLVKFVMQAQVDTTAIIETNKTFKGNALRGETLYKHGMGSNVGCVVCHGSDGLAPPPGYPGFVEYPGKIADENPWEFQHKVRFGHPGTDMPSAWAGGASLQDVADVAAYAQTLPVAHAPGDAARGGVLYDSYWAVIGAPAPTGNHPLWASRPDLVTNPRTGPDTFRCKECHGWDYKGVNGAYGSGSHRTGIAGIFGTTKSEAELTDLLKNHHGYTALGLSDGEIEHLVKFVRQAQVDTTAIIETNRTFKGSVVRGETLYKNGMGSNVGCVVCHGSDGLAPPPGYPGFVEYPGKIANENPWEFQHKVRFGHPGTAMPSAWAGGASLQDVADVAAYCQTLPIAPTPGDAARGGALYDSYWPVIGAPAPTGNHPLWASRPDLVTNPRTGPDTFRCKECHGWDYKGVNGAYGSGSHRTGIGGIFGTTKSEAELTDLLKNHHGYTALGLSDGEIENLVKFVRQAQVDTTAIIETNRTFKGNVVRGETLYKNGMGSNVGCVVCHGSDGLAAPPGYPGFVEYPGKIANENPWEFQHKVRFGHPGTPMPSAWAGGASLQDVADVAAYYQTLPIAPTPGDAARGGALYDSYWPVIGAPAPTGNHPLWASRPDLVTNPRTGPDTFRCKECHGWDYKGVNGAYGSGSHRTGIGGVFGTTKTEGELTELLKDHHGYTALGLNDAEIEHLVKFVRQAQIDTTAIIETNKTFKGNVARGETLYKNGMGSNVGCATCHGDDGLTPPPGYPAFVEYPGKIANENPWEFQHKVRFGHPGTPMPSAWAGGASSQDVADVSAYCQTLPIAPAPGP